MAHDIFISYSERDKNVAHAICASLENAHMRCWYAPRNILAGESPAEAVPKAIREARIFVLVFTDSANDSEQILREVNLAVTAGCGWRRIVSATIEVQPPLVLASALAVMERRWPRSTAARPSRSTII